MAGLSLDSDEIRTPNPDGWFYTGKEWRCELWVSNWPPLKFYLDVLKTQWRVAAGMDRLIYLGLDYNVLLHELDRRDLSRDDYDDLFGSVRVIEDEAKKQLNKPA